ncbi:MAG TPA: hypothetical protein VKM55_24510 [Candidatus Lokiarchaeia archaeon]|nr:hypothetical protein [Candidatus Lokiarchaeia archaeon]
MSLEKKMEQALESPSEDLANSSDKLRVNFSCKICNKFHKIEIERSLFKSQEFPVSYTYLHGEPPFAAILYIDANCKVRGVDYSKGFAVGKTELDEVLLSSKARCLTSIPNDEIIAFRLLHEKNLLKFFTKPEFESVIDFTAILDIVRHSTLIMKDGESCSKFFMKFTELWVAVFEMMEYVFILVVSGTVDIEHLGIQGMAMFETLMA